LAGLMERVSNLSAPGQRRLKRMGLALNVINQSFMTNLMALNIRIVPPRSEYAELLHKWRNEPITQKYNPVKDRNLGELRDGLEKALTSLSPFDYSATYRWFIECESRIVGTVSLSEINDMMKTAEVGYMVGKIDYGKGIASAALRVWTAMIFEKSDLRKLTASVAEENHASLRVLEKVGYQREGLLRDHYLIQGEPVSQLVFGLLRDEFQEMNRKP
jgi:[ribosomal protein S5]-alanine N-acetyltransferase